MKDALSPVSAEVAGVFEAPPASVRQGPCGAAGAGKEDEVKIGLSLGGSGENE